MIMHGRARRRFLLAAAVAAAVPSLFFSDLLSATTSGFWRNHAMSGAIVSGSVLFLFGVLFVEGWIENREGQVWERVSSVSFRSLGSGQLMITQAPLVLADLD